MRQLTLILGYSTAGNSPSNVLLNRTKPEYSAWFACLLSRSSEEAEEGAGMERWFRRVTGTIPARQLLHHLFSHEQKKRRYGRIEPSSQKMRRGRKGRMSRWKSGRMMQTKGEGERLTNAIIPSLWDVIMYSPTISRYFINSIPLPSTSFILSFWTVRRI